MVAIGDIEPGNPRLELAGGVDDTRPDRRRRGLGRGLEKLAHRSAAGLEQFREKRKPVLRPELRDNKHQDGGTDANKR